MGRVGRAEGYQGLLVWQKAMDLVVDIYRVSGAWPKEETFGLTNQARRAAISIPSNIAEGQGRFGPREFLHHLSIARGSLHEVETQLLIAQRLEYGDVVACQALLSQTAEVGRLLLGLIKRLRTTIADRPTP